MDIGTFCERVFTICKIYGGSATSWVRSVAHNKALPGSVPNSKHLDGLALDVVLDDPAQQEAFLAACRNAKLRAFFDKDHIHIEAL